MLRWSACHRRRTLLCHEVRGEGTCNASLARDSVQLLWVRDCEKRIQGYGRRGKVVRLPAVQTVGYAGSLACRRACVRRLLVAPSAKCPCGFLRAPSRNYCIHTQTNWHRRSKPSLQVQTHKPSSSPDTVYFPCECICQCSATWCIMTENMVKVNFLHSVENDIDSHTREFCTVATGHHMASGKTKKLGL